MVERVPDPAGSRICPTNGNFSRRVSIWVPFQDHPARNVDSWRSHPHHDARQFPDRLSRLDRTELCMRRFGFRVEQEGDRLLRACPSFDTLSNSWRRYFVDRLVCPMMQTDARGRPDVKGEMLSSTMMRRSIFQW